LGAQDDETCRVMLEQPGSEVVLLQLGSMLQLVAMPEETGVNAAYHAVEALVSVTRLAEGQRQVGWRMGHTHLTLIRLRAEATMSAEGHATRQTQALLPLRCVRGVCVYAYSHDACLVCGRVTPLAARSRVCLCGREQVMAKGSFPGRVMATRPPEEVVQGMMRDLLSGIAALVNAPDPALVTLAVKLLKNLVSHELVIFRPHPRAPLVGVRSRGSLHLASAAERLMMLCCLSLLPPSIRRPSEQ